MLVHDMRTKMCETKKPESTLEVDLEELPRSVAYEMQGGKLIVKFEPDVPSVRVGRESFMITEAPAIVAGGKKHHVEEIF